MPSKCIIIATFTLIVFSVLLENSEALWSRGRVDVRVGWKKQAVQNADNVGDERGEVTGTLTENELDELKTFLENGEEKQKRSADEKELKTLEEFVDRMEN